MSIQLQWRWRYLVRTLQKALGLFHNPPCLFYFSYCLAMVQWQRHFLCPLFLGWKHRGEYSSLEEVSWVYVGGVIISYRVSFISGTAEDKWFHANAWGWRRIKSMKIVFAVYFRVSQCNPSLILEFHFNKPCRSWTFYWILLIHHSSMLLSCHMSPEPYCA